MSDDNAWAKAMEEAESPDQRDKGLWAKCFAEAGGDDTKAKAAYVKIRATAMENAVLTSTQAHGYCPRCGTMGSMADKGCFMCGLQYTGTTRPLYARPAKPEPQAAIRVAKSRGIYIILGLFFGMLGIHNFYVGRLGVGAAQLLITLILGWFVVGLIITFVWVLIDLISVTKDGKGLALD